jgi:hemoglobin/transferrin/lactoferrin receptor protein
LSLSLSGKKYSTRAHKVTRRIETSQNSATIKQTNLNKKLICQYKMSKVFIAFFFACVAQSSIAQSVQGTVTDQQSGKPIPDVSVSITNSSYGTVTDREGKFALRIFTETAIVRFSAVGYTPFEKIVSHGDETLDVTLEPSVILLNNQITITAQRYERNLSDVAQAASTISTEELEQTAPRSTPEALMGSTGVWVQKTNHGGGSPIIRGLVGNQILLMMDGIRMNNATYRYGPNQYLSTVDPGLIDRIETTRGSGSVLYGSDALGGVVQVISKNPVFASQGYSVHGNVNGRWMSAGMEKSGRGEIQLSTQKLAFLGGLSHRDYGHVVAGGNLGTLKPTAYYEYSGDAKLLWKIGSAGVLTFAHQQLTQHNVPRYDQVVQGGYSRYDFEPQTRQLDYIRWETFTNHKWVESVRLAAAYNKTTEGVIAQREGQMDFRKLNDQVDTWSVIGEVHSQLSEKWEMLSGLEYYHDQVKSKAWMVQPHLNTEIEQRGSYADGAVTSNMAFFSNHILDLNRLVVSAGLRFNMVTVSVDDAIFGSEKITPDALVGNVHLNYSLSSPFNLFLGASTGFRAPNIDDMSKLGPVESSVYEIPSEGLAPERSKSIELGFKATGHTFSGSVSGYYTQLVDLIDRVPVVFQGMDTIENRRVYQKQNVSEAELYGMEAEGELKLHDAWVAYGNMTYTHGQNISRQEPLRRIPPLFGKLGVRFKRGGLWARAEWMVAGEQRRLAAGDKSDNRISVRLVDGAMPGWNTFNFYAGYQLRFLNISASLQNAFDEAYRVYASGIDAYGRNLRLSVTARF